MLMPLPPVDARKLSRSEHSKSQRFQRADAPSSICTSSVAVVSVPRRAEAAGGKRSAFG